MSIFGKRNEKPVVNVKPVKSEVCIEGLRKLEEGGFLSEQEKIEGDFDVPASYAYSEGYLYGSQLIKGTAGEQLAQIEEFIRKYALQSDIMPKIGKVYNYEMDALMELIAFLMANRDVESEDLMNIACVKGGIEVAVKGRPSRYCLMKKTLDEAMDAFAENGNGYPVITCEDGDIILAAWVHPFFKKPDEVRSNAKLAGMMFGGFAGVDALDKKVLKFMK